MLKSQKIPNQMLRINVLNFPRVLGSFGFEFVSDFDIRISDFVRSMLAR